MNVLTYTAWNFNSIIKNIGSDTLFKCRDVFDTINFIDSHVGNCFTNCEFCKQECDVFLKMLVKNELR